MRVTLFTAANFFEQVGLDLLYLEQTLPLMGQQQIHLGVQVTNLQFRFQIHSVVVIGLQAIYRTKTRTRKCR